MAWIFNRVIEHLDKNKEPAAVVRLLLECLQESSLGFRALFFTFGEWKKGTIEQAVKELPELGSCLEPSRTILAQPIPKIANGEIVSGGPVQTKKGPRYISNVGGFGLLPPDTLRPKLKLNANGRQLSLDTIFQVVEGMGSRFSYTDLYLIFWDILSNVQSRPGDTFHQLQPQSCIELHMEATKKYVKKTMDIFFETKLDSNSGLSQPFSSREEKFLASVRDRIGFELPLKSSVFVVQEPGQPHDDSFGKPVRQALNAVSSRFYFAELFASLDFPYELTQEPSSERRPLPYKKTLTRHFEPKGFEVGSAGSGIMLAAKDYGKFSLRIEFDFGSWSKNLMTTLYVKTAGWERSIQLPCGAGADTCVIESEDQLKKAIANIATAYCLVEDKYMPALQNALSALETA